MRERDIEEYLLKRVKAMGGEVRKVKWIGRRGAPDRLVMLKWGRPPFWVELKAPGKRPTEQQRREHVRMLMFGADVQVVDSLKRVDEVLS